MSVDKQELRRLAADAIFGHWFKSGDLRYSDDKTGEVHGLNVEDDRFIAAANPAAILSLLDEGDGLMAQHSRDSAELRALCQARDEARRERDQLRAELEQYRKDALRYRWLRGRLPGSSYRIAGVIYSEGGEGIDEAIDAAMAKEQSQ